MFLQGSNGLNPREGIITEVAALGSDVRNPVRSNGLNPREGIITLGSDCWHSGSPLWFKWLKSSGGDYYTLLRIRDSRCRSSVQMA